MDLDPIKKQQEDRKMEKTEALQTLLSIREFCAYTLLNLKSEESRNSYQKYIDAIDVIFKSVIQNE